MASADGWFYMFDVNTQEGGVCRLLTQASIHSSNPALFTNNPIGNNPVNNNIVNTNLNNTNDDINNHQYQHQQQLYDDNQSNESNNIR